jgi:hypothetical protein
MHSVTLMLQTTSMAIPVRLVAIEIKLHPGNLVSLLAQDGAAGRTLLTRSQFLGLGLAFSVDDVDLGGDEK